MSVTDYASLQTAINSWYNRDDLSTYIDYLIQMAENKIYRDIFSINQGKGVANIEATLSGTISSGTIPVPSGYLGLKYAYVVISGNSVFLERKNGEFIYSTYPQRSADGPPGYIAKEGTNFIFGPYPDSAYTVGGVYWAKATGLSSSNTTTWMTSDIPDILTACSNYFAGVKTEDDAAAQKWLSIYNDQMGDFIATAKAEAYSGSAPSVKMA